MTHRRLVVAALAALVVSVCGAPFLLGDPGGRALDGDNPSADGSLGQRIFMQETFGGNGRTCGTCHRPESEYALSPDAVRSIHERDSHDPLFRPIDSDGDRGTDFTSLIEHALIRVEIPLAGSVRLVDDPGRRTIVVRRAVPSIVNAALTAPYQLDGRSPTLQAQALAAVRNHFEPSRDPSPRELAALARFESEVFDQIGRASCRERVYVLV